MRRVSWLSILALCSACGAKTGLLVPELDAAEAVDAVDALDAPDVFDADDVVDAPDLPDACAAQRQPAVRFSAEVIFVIDRSGSMADSTPSGASRWTALTSSLTQVLPSVDRELWTGLVLYPNAGSTSTLACSAPLQLTYTPRVSNASRILGALRDTGLGGGTPTFNALQAASSYFAMNPPLGPLRGRFLVLTTDGGPNCNASLDARSCECTNSRGCGGSRGNLSCLDEARTVSLLRDLAARGVPTFVIGTGSDVQVMNNLAVAGGRARPAALGGTRYYRAEDTPEFVENFRAITTSLVRCRFVTNPVPAGVEARVRVGSAVVLEDPSGVDGFSWERREAGEFTLSGSACDAAARSGGAVYVELPCAR
ncbi:MAG: vWA domain-containing protein [Polyangiales bacterium]